MSNRRTKLIILALLSMAANCSIPMRDLRQEQNMIVLPPAELLQANYALAADVLVVILDNKQIEKIISADSGEPGYIVTRESGIALKALKGNYQPGDRIVFQDWIEYDPNWQKSRPDTVLAFFKVDEKSGVLTTIGEAAVFEFHPKLLELLNDANSTHSESAPAPREKRPPTRTPQK